VSSDPILMTDAHRIMIARFGSQWIVSLAVVSSSQEIVHQMPLYLAQDPEDVGEYLAKNLPEPGGLQ
jgi:hypothetical protein